MAFDLDDEELKATRKLNGSDKNVGSIEEDIKIVEEILITNKKFGKYLSDRKLIAIEHLIKAYKELEEENEIIKGNYYTLCADIQMVTTELGFPEDTIIADEMVSMIKENYIEKSLVEKKIQELETKMEYENNEKVLIWLHKQRSVLQELLEKRE